MAAVPKGNFEVRHEANAAAYKVHPSSGYSPALSAGDFRFVPGQTAEALDEPAPQVRGCRVVYVSPLKALAVPVIRSATSVVPALVPSVDHSSVP